MNEFANQIANQIFIFEEQTGKIPTHVHINDRYYIMLKRYLIDLLCYGFSNHSKEYFMFQGVKVIPCHYVKEMNIEVLINLENLNK